MLRYLAHQISETKHYHCAAELHASLIAPRVDAQASSNKTDIGGWFPAIGPDGSIDIIATLEALAVLVALKLWFGEVPKQQQTRVVMVPSLTDNRGNGALHNKLMTTKFPASTLMMELSTHRKKMNRRRVVEWFPRECNREADGLANGDTACFSPSLRLPMTPASLHWYILEDTLRAGAAAEAEHLQAASRGELPDRCRKQKRKKHQNRLRVTDPW